MIPLRPILYLAVLFTSIPTPCAAEPPYPVAPHSRNVEDTRIEFSYLVRWSGHTISYSVNIHDWPRIEAHKPFEFVRIFSLGTISDPDAVNAFVDIIRRAHLAAQNNEPFEETLNTRSTNYKFTTSDKKLQIATEEDVLTLGLKQLKELEQAHRDMKTASAWLNGLDDELQQTNKELTRPVPDDLSIAVRCGTLLEGDKAIEITLLYEYRSGNLSRAYDIQTTVGTRSKSGRRNFIAPATYHTTALLDGLAALEKRAAYESPPFNLHPRLIVKTNKEFNSLILEIDYVGEKETRALSLDQLREYKKLVAKAEADKEWFFANQEQLFTRTKPFIIREPGRGAELRTWTNRDGVSIRAKLNVLNGDLMNLMREDGRRFDLHVNDLSPESFKIIEAIRAGRLTP